MSNNSSALTFDEIAAQLQVKFSYVYDFIQIPTSIFLFIMLGPLYKVAKERIALNILFSKTCCTMMAQILLAAFQTEYFIMGVRIQIISTVYPYISKLLNATMYMHIIALAINRFCAIFFPFQYMQIWTRKFTLRYSLAIWLFGLGYTIFKSLVQAGFIPISIDFTIFQWAIFGASAFIYGTMLIKFGYGYFFKSSSLTSLSANLASVEKDRVLLSAICFISLVPIPVNQALSDISPLLPYGSPIWMFVSCLIIANLSVVNCVEECCLLIFCKDFRVLVRKRFTCGKFGAPKINPSNSTMYGGGGTVVSAGAIAASVRVNSHNNNGTMANNGGTGPQNATPNGNRTIRV